MRCWESNPLSWVEYGYAFVILDEVMDEGDEGNEGAQWILVDNGSHLYRGAWRLCVRLSDGRPKLLSPDTRVEPQNMFL